MYFVIINFIAIDESFVVVYHVMITRVRNGTSWFHVNVNLVASLLFCYMHAGLGARRVVRYSILLILLYNESVT